MARITSEITFTGSLGNVTAYRMRGVDGIVLRQKGGASKEKIKSSPAFANTRRNNAEFGGRARASRWIMRMLWPQKALADYNIAGPLNALMKPIQALDTVSEWGKRNIILSKNPRLLEGFSLNRKTPFDSMIRTSLSYSLSRETRTAHIDIPELLPGINFYAPKSHPMFSVVAVLGMMPDLYYSEMGYVPSASGYEETHVQSVSSEWCPVLKKSPATTLTLMLDAIPPDNAYSLILSVGVRFGTMQDATTVQQVKYAGCAKVLTVG